jgi:hypothetical protein
MDHRHQKIFIKYIIIINLIAFPMLSIAMFCPKNFNQISIGDSLEQVLAQCGRPDVLKESKKINDNIPQEWSYFIPQAVSSNTFNQAQGTLKASVAFDGEGKAINISVNGIGVGATGLCGKYVKLGDTRETIQTACGDPALVNRRTNAQTGQPLQGQEIKVMELTYSSIPPVVLVFENGKLTERR